MWGHVRCPATVCVLCSDCLYRSTALHAKWPVSVPFVTKAARCCCPALLQGIVESSAALPRMALGGEVHTCLSMAMLPWGNWLQQTS